ncbi:dienelactone hydrolase family protein [Nocardia gamkensis]|uniref:Dienelactone hydrolase n=1 Tax=Nocardia gamkensis TaxID=352869 RepID=A0A7X6KZL1_9NOCA|nr:dienelactone hydrolase family protein [Nocardia gamkensis]NKY25092.1 dienelactone hydrolase [Nocardia gamkensis]
MSNEMLNDFERHSFSYGGKTRTVYRRGTGPAVLVLAEVPGITPKVLDFARRVSETGCTAVVPHLFGTPGWDPAQSGRVAAAVHRASVIVPACVSREFVLFATGRTSPVVDWLRALSRSEHERCGGPGVGVVGMCFTGGFALAMAVEEHMLAAVMSQPSLPLAITNSRKRTIDVSEEDLGIVRRRCASKELEVLGIRFADDPVVPADRFDFLHERLGDSFTSIVLDSSAANPDTPLRPHSVLTEHLIDEPGEPTRDALDQVLSLLREKLVLRTEDPSRTSGS